MRTLRSDLRSIAQRLRKHIDAYCIDLDVDITLKSREPFPDPYAIHRLGLKAYYEIYEKTARNSRPPMLQADMERETYMARRLKELSSRYDRVLFMGGMAHFDSNVLRLIESSSFPEFYHADREAVEICTLDAESCREVLAEWGFLTLSMK